MTQPATCRRCHRPLKAPFWVKAGLGPVCARKLGLTPARRQAPTTGAPANESKRVTEHAEGQLVLFEEEHTEGSEE